MKILVPTDFSSSANNAANYAAALAQIMQASVTFLHIIIPTFDEDYLLTTDTRALKTDALKHLKNFSKDIQYRYHVQCEEMVAVAETTTEILSIAECHNIDLIIVGMHGASGFRKLILNSNIISLLEFALVPVLLIPEDLTFEPLRGISQKTQDGGQPMEHLLEKQMSESLQEV